MATSKEMSTSKEMGMSRDMGMSMQGVGHLYMQTNEARNCIIDYTRSANGAFAGQRQLSWPVTTTILAG
jgi:hypothetical protein